MTWCIALFTTAADAAVIVGDLDEEWRGIAARDGERVARRWYWHQMLRTIAQLAVAPLRESPLPFLLLGALGFGVMLPLSWAAVWFAGQVVVRVPVYQYVPAPLFWWTAGVLPLPIVGTTIAIIMGRRAMAGALAVISAMAVWVAVIDPLLLMRRLPSDHLPGVAEYLAHTLFIFSIHALLLLSATAVGVAIRQRRTRGRAPEALSAP